MLTKLWPFLFLAASMPYMAHGEGDPYDAIRHNREEEFAFDESLVKKWKEETGAIPAPPLSDDDLIKIAVARLGEDFKVMFDPKSLTTGKDRVLRYWLVVKGKLGAVNTMYEGMRCSTGQFKTYAYASRRKKGKISKMKRAKWIPVKGLRGKDYHEELALDFFCNFGLPRSKEDIIARAKKSGIQLYIGDEPAASSSFF